MYFLNLILQTHRSCVLYIWNYITFTVTLISTYNILCYTKNHAIVYNTISTITPISNPPPPKKIIRDRDIFNRILDKLRTLREGKLFKKKEYKPMDRAVIHCRNLKSDLVSKKFTIHYAECNMLQIAIPFVTWNVKG